ncbi:nucleotide exchange factor GrpE [Actinomadura verrucosospora]|uniref:Heat shock protein GrpE n=1 Tax=Actinomadura verrucosospora TaxID=46165 RepID=A0A7D3VQP4_ACTVE|nr:nucleotide exchange factor GrpE [Actinomadura verrucosospora]QKG20578.1 heat shock protein GrpE [Actinomadura verrucosospora]
MSSDGDRTVNDGADAGTGDAAPAGAGEGRAAFEAEVRDALAGLTARLDRERERAAHREAVIDRLHEENQRLRRGELQAMLEPVRAALYRLHDQARREAGRLAGPDAGEPADPVRTAGLFAAVADDVADALARLGVERFTARPGEPYDASRHRPVAVTPVAEPGRDGLVTGVQADGFEQGGKVLRKAAVSVGRLDRAANGAASSSTADGTADAEEGARLEGRAAAGAPNGAAAAAGARAGSGRTRAAGRGETTNNRLGTDG